MNRDQFFTLAANIFRKLHGDEILFCNLDAEDSDFVRLNNNRIRQAGNLRSRVLSLSLIDGRRQAQAACDLSGDQQTDMERASKLLRSLRERIPHVPDDPYLNYSTEAGQSDRQASENLPDSAQVIADLTRSAEGLDLVGIWASGEIAAGLASSLGHRHWHASISHNLDFSCYLRADKAVKANLSGLTWKPDALRERLARVRRDLEIMARPARTIEPGRYRAFLAPAAVAEIMDMLAWGGFGLKDHRTSQTPLLRLAREERSFDERVALYEDQVRGLAPGFTTEGFDKPESVGLISKGRYRECLVDSRSGKEYEAPVNAATEHPESLAMDPGDIPIAEVLQRLGTGLYIGNLWYLNYADRNNCRITGMTRFATFWVERGEALSPVQPMRFDDSLYHLLGDRLVGITQERALLISPETYDGRSTSSALLPGLLVDGLELTL